MKYLATLLFIMSFSVFYAFPQTDDILDEETENYTDEKGLKQGTWVEYWDNKRVKYEVSYKDDLKEGVEMTYFKSGDCVQQEAYYKAGKLDGTLTVKYEDCTVKSTTEYKDGLKNGGVITYYSNGNKESEATYVNDQLQGTVKMYDKDGGFLQETTSAAPETFDMDDYIAGEVDFADTVVLSVFGRHPEWKNKLIVADVTLGMEPYAAQLIVWENMKLIKTEKRQYVFFNDGDDKEQAQKVIGKTGGIYYCEGSASKVKKTMKQVMAAGTGGDVEENDIEAIVSALTLGKAYQQVILIADNASGVRDMKSIKRLKKPVMIVLCGLGDTDVIHPDYLAIAKQTNGSIHTIHDDAKDLGKVLEGSEISIEQLKYKLEGGVFKAVK